MVKWTPSILGDRSVAASCKCDSEPPGSIEGGELVD